MTAAADWMGWGVLLLVLFPILTVALGEVVDSISRDPERQIFATPFAILRNALLPLAFVDILLRNVVGMAGDTIAVKIADTALWIVALNAALAFLNIFFFGERATLSGRLQIPKLLLDILRLFFVICGAAVIISRIWDINLGSLITALGVGSVVIGLALQDTLGSLFAGIALVSARHFKVGDWIKFGTDEGPVLTMNWRSVTIRTRNGDALVLPNGVIARQPVTVLGKPAGSMALGVELRFPYQYSPDSIVALLADAARRTKDFHLDPAPVARAAAFEDHAIRYAIAVRAADPLKLYAVRGDYLTNVWFLCRRQGIAMIGQFNTRFQIPPQQLPPEQHTPDDLVHVVKSLAVFPGQDARLDRLLAGARLERYRDGQALIEPGKVAAAIHIVVTGRARAIHAGASGSEIQLHEFEGGQVVASKATLRGSASLYLVRAAGELEVIAVPLADFKAFCTADMQLAQEMEQMLSAREEAAERVLAKALPERAPRDLASDRVEILRDMFRT